MKNEDHLLTLFEVLPDNEAKDQILDQMIEAVTSREDLSPEALRSIIEIQRGMLNEARGRVTELGTYEQAFDFFRTPYSPQLPVVPSDPDPIDPLSQAIVSIPSTTGLGDLTEFQRAIIVMLKQKNRLKPKEIIQMLSPQYQNGTTEQAFYSRCMKNVARLAERGYIVKDRAGRWKPIRYKKTNFRRKLTRYIDDQPGISHNELLEIFFVDPEIISRGETWITRSMNRALAKMEDDNLIEKREGNGDTTYTLTFTPKPVNPKLYRKMWLNWTIHRGRGRPTEVECEVVVTLEQAVKRARALTDEYEGKHNGYWISDFAITVPSKDGIHDREVDQETTKELERLLNGKAIEQTL